MTEPEEIDELHNALDAGLGQLTPDFTEAEKLRFLRWVVAELEARAARLSHQLHLGEATR